MGLCCLIGHPSEPSRGQPYDNHSSGPVQDYPAASPLPQAYPSQVTPPSPCAQRPHFCMTTFDARKPRAQLDVKRKVPSIWRRVPAYSIFGLFDGHNRSEQWKGWKFRLGQKNENCHNSCPRDCISAWQGETTRCHRKKLLLLAFSTLGIENKDGIVFL